LLKLEMVFYKATPLPLAFTDLILGEFRTAVNRAILLSIYCLYGRETKLKGLAPKLTPSCFV
jgi:hypothetical protein